MAIRIGIDTGGTFTDLVAVDDASGRWYLAKVPSNPAQPVAAIRAALEQAAFDPADVESIVVGTTIGINAVLTRSGARVAYLTTAGFEDIPHIQRINRKHHYDFRWRKPVSFAARRDCIGVDERVDAYGDVLVDLDEDGVREVARRIAASRDDGEEVAVAVCFLFSYLQPGHERRARELIEEAAPGLPVSLSHEIAPIWREYERGTAAILDAYTKPALARYVAGVSEAFAAQGADASWSLLKSNGGHAVAEQALQRPAHVLLSGIAGGAIGGAHVARSAGAGHAIVVDMGGTSCDVCLVVDGAPLYSSEYEIEFGLPVSVPTIHTHTIGAGGGSIGWVDPGGFLQVGPRSAGADPGPACYGSGGVEPTITDADLLLRRLDPAYFLGGDLALDPARSEEAIGRLAEALGQEPVEVASAMVRVANESMANAIRILTVEQGIDPRDFAIVAMGGAGPTHACGIAESIGIGRVLVPPHPGVTSAFGALAAPVRVDEVRSVAMSSTDLDPEAVGTVLAELEEAARASFEAQSPTGERPRRERSIAMRYQGQNYEQEVPLPDGELDLDATFERYHELHEGFYGYRFDGAPIELVRVSVTLSGAEPDLPPLRIDARAGGRAGGTEDVHFEGDGFVPTAIVARDAVDGERAGPVIVQSVDTTVVVPPGWTLRGLDGGIMELRRDAA